MAIFDKNLIILRCQSRYLYNVSNDGEYLTKRRLSSKLTAKECSKFGNIFSKKTNKKQQVHADFRPEIYNLRPDIKIFNPIFKISTLFVPFFSWSQIV